MVENLLSACTGRHLLRFMRARLPNRARAARAGAAGAFSLDFGAGGGRPHSGENPVELRGKTVAVLVEQQYQEMEVWYPYYRLKEAGATVVMVAPEAGKTYASKLGYPAKSEKAAKEMTA